MIERQIDKLSDLESQERALGNYEAADDALEWRTTMRLMNEVCEATQEYWDVRSNPKTNIALNLIGPARRIERALANLKEHCGDASR